MTDRLAILVILAAIGCPPSPTKAQEHPPQARRRISFSLANDTKENTPTPTVVAHQALPLRVEVTDSGSGRQRRLRVLVAVYEKASEKRFVVGPHVTTHLISGIMTTNQGESNSKSFKADIDLKKGDYIFYVILCDPDEPYSRDPNLPNYMPPDASFPGRVVKVRGCVAHIK